MSENEKKKKKRSELGVIAERTAAAQLEDRASGNLRKAASAVGNEELKQRIEKGQAGRDEMLQFMVERLQTIREVQVQELEMSSVRDQRDWWRKVADKGKSEYTKPDPTQWREVARFYEEAAYQICRGALGRGRDLVERGIEAEKKKMGSLTRLVDTTEIETEIDPPDVMGQIGSDDACPNTNVPQEIKGLAHEIQNVTMIAKDPPNRKRKRDPWWTLWEEEEEEEEGGGGAPAE